MQNKRLYERLHIERDNGIDPHIQWRSQHDDDYQNIFDDPPGQGGFSSLAGINKFFDPSNVQPTILRPHRWYLSSVRSTMLRPNDSYLARIRAKANDQETSHLDDHGGTEVEERTEVEKISPRSEVDGAKTKTYDSSTKDSRTDESGPYRPGGQEQGQVIPTQPKCFRPDEDMADIVEHSILSMESKGRKRRRSSNTASSTTFRRKCVCVRCWKTRSLCDFHPQCGNCLVAEVKCVRKLCDSGVRHPYPCPQYKTICVFSDGLPCSVLQCRG